MRFLANENFPGAAVSALEAAGHDVVWVSMIGGEPMDIGDQSRN